MGIHRDRPALKPGERVLWIVLIVGSGFLSSTLYACATPLVAFATIGALKLDRGSTIATMAFVWLVNQAVGYGLLGYPWTWNSVAWGVAIGVASGLAVLAAIGLSTSRSAPFAVSLPFVAAFATFELSLDVTGWVLSGDAGAFSAAIIAHVFLINALALCGLMVFYGLALMVGQFAWSAVTRAPTLQFPSLR